ncbi:MAG: fructose-6-phosphate aldolase [Alphaproteobacteria bacterium]|nr:MAG: fructose-6-phosphate aldolase [Alphaproteobacteria bacterium]
MEFFADTADVEAIRELGEAGLIDGVTTNPTLVAKTGRDFLSVIGEICAITEGPVSAEVASTDFTGMVAEGERLADIAGNVVIKLPLTLDGLKACAHFRRVGIRTNVTLCFSAAQAILAAKAGASYVSPFIGRMDDINLDGVALIRDIRRIFDNYGFETKLLAASIRSPNHVTRSALAGADVATCPPTVIKSLVAHPLTEKGLHGFLSDWKRSGQSIV